MAKCTICRSKKGKRKCRITETFICSPCCGETRNADACEGCSYFSPASAARNYKKAPHFPLKRMADDMVLEKMANVVESAICQFDEQEGRRLTDRAAAGVIERLLDKYYFNDADLNFASALEEKGFHFVDGVIVGDLDGPPDETFVKIIATVYRSALRRMTGGRGYMDFIHEYVGIRAGPGVRVLDRTVLGEMR